MTYSKNLLFKGDNLAVLKTLIKTHAKKIKCIYVDPPYNTGINRKHFRDDKTSKEWGLWMNERLLLAYELLRNDGSIWLSIDDFELANLKAICEKIFGESNFLATITWQHKIRWDGYKGKFQLDHSYILAFQKTASFSFENGAKPSTVWLEKDVGGQKEAIEESRLLFGENEIFSTPKPEGLIKYILELTTKEGEIILDCFSGSGTSGAAAQKMGRGWIMMEIGEQCYSHILPRMQSIRLNQQDGNARHQESSQAFKFFEDIEKYS